jgi:N-acetyl-gamma-glutamylphosphate reductase
VFQGGWHAGREETAKSLQARQSRVTNPGCFDISPILSIFPLPQVARESHRPPASERSENPA